MREQLVGYVLGALDDEDRRGVEAALADPRGGGLRRDLEVIRAAVAPLARDSERVPVPAGLASRTLAFVAAQTVESRAEVRPLTPNREEGRPRGRVWLDRALMAATALAACVLVLPLLRQAVDDARDRRKERNLTRLGQVLQEYADDHRDCYPTPPSEGPLSRAGLWAPTLVSEERIRADDGTVLVPGSALARRGDFRVPSLAELEAAKGTERFEQLLREMGGDYGYTLGYRDANGILQPNRNLGRSDHPLLADDPDETAERTDNDPRGIHHILFEDGHVVRRGPEDLHQDDDHLYKNDRGEVAAGVDPDDAVIGDSEDKP